MPVVFGLLGAAAALAVLFLPRAIGLADNGDEVRLACHLGLTPDYVWGQHQYGTSANFTYVHGRPPAGLVCGAQSSAILPMRLAAQLSRLLPGHHPLDTRVLGVAYALLLGVGLGLLVAGLPRRRALRCVAGVALLAVLADVGFVSYFSTGYSEPLGFVGLVASVGLVMVGWRRPGAVGIGWLVTTTVAMAMTVMAKPQYGLLAAVFALALGATRWRGGSGVTRRVVPAACAALVLVAGVSSVRSTPVSYRRANRYNAFFTELLGHSPDPTGDVRAFGLPDSLARYAGTTSFTSPNATTSPAFEQFPTKVTYPTLLAFYARHPTRAWHLYARGARAGADPRAVQLGMFPYDPAHPERRRTCRWCAASVVGRWAAPAAPIGGGLLWIGLVLLGAVELGTGRDDRRGLAVGVLVAAGASAVLFATAVLGDGIELVKHLLLADAAFALTVVLGGALAASRVSERWASRRGDRRAGDRAVVGVDGDLA